MLIQARIVTFSVVLTSFLFGLATFRAALVVVATAPAGVHLPLPTVIQMAERAESPAASLAATVGQFFRIDDWRIRAAGCHARGTCTTDLISGVPSAPQSGELAAVVSLWANDPSTVVLELVRSCRLSPREAWIARIRVASSSRVADDGFASLRSCFDADISLLLSTDFWRNELAAVYLSDPVARSRIAVSLTDGLPRGSYAFLEALEERASVGGER